MKVVALYECLENQDGEDFKGKREKANGWAKIGQKAKISQISAADAKTKFRSERKC